MADRYTLDQARAIIDAEKCVRGQGDQWCRRHGHFWPLWQAECKARPEVADVAAQLLATVERVQALADEWKATADLASKDWRAVLHGAARRLTKAIGEREEG